MTKFLYFSSLQDMRAINIALLLCVTLAFELSAHPTGTVRHVAGINDNELICLKKTELAAIIAQTGNEEPTFASRLRHKRGPEILFEVE